MKMLDCQRLKSFVTLILIILPVYLMSQDSICEFSPQWYIQTNIGASYGHTDIAKYNEFPEWPDFQSLSTGLDIGIGRQISPVIGFYASFYRGFLKGANDNDERFESDIFDYKLNATINFNKLFNGSSNNKLNFHTSFGIGQAQYKTKVMDERGTTLYGYQNSLGDLRGSGMNDRRVVMIFPVSIGVDFKLSEKVQLYGDFALKFTNSDLVDGKITEGNNDSYNYTSIGIRYNFRKRKKDDPINKVEDMIEDKAKIMESKTDSIPSQTVNIESVMVEKISNAVVEKLKPVIQAAINPKPNINGKVEIESDKEEVKSKQTVKGLVSADSITDQSTRSSIEYCVQIQASYNKPLDVSELSKKFNLAQSRITYKGIYNKWHLYTVGSFSSLIDAKKEMNYLKEKYGIADAFVICFENGVRFIK